jgi:hypothetical protein
VWCRIYPLCTVHYNQSFACKGIVSRKCILFFVSFKSPTTVNELGYVAGFVNSVGTYEKRTEEHRIFENSTLNQSSFKIGKEAKILKLPNLRIILKNIYKILETIPLNILPISLFLFVSVVFVLFRFNRNTETRCFDIEPKQTKQTSCFG